MNTQANSNSKKKYSKAVATTGIGFLLIAAALTFSFANAGQQLVSAQPYGQSLSNATGGMRNASGGLGNATGGALSNATEGLGNATGGMRNATGGALSNATEGLANATGGFANTTRSGLANATDNGGPLGGIGEQLSKLFGGG
ncbi:MAG TPA: hypothetical protein VGE97_08160 [Nitrososphaera sp.]